MADWRIGRGWSEAEIRHQTAHLAGLTKNFEDDPADLPHIPGWYTYSSESVVGRGSVGPPAAGGPFERGCSALKSYEFSDARIVKAYFDEESELLHRRMLLEIRAFRLIRFLSGVQVGAVRSEQDDNQSIYSFRYDTLEGHLERGSEWFTLRQDHATGAIRFRISASWRRGQLPNWWSRVGFELVGTYYQEKWHRRAHEIMARVVQRPAPAPAPSTSRMAASRTPSPEIIFEKRTLNAQ